MNYVLQKRNLSCQFAKLFGLFLLVYPSNAGRQFVELCRGGLREFGGKYCQQKVFSFAICVTQAEAEHICAEQFTEPQPSKQGDGLQSFHP